MLFTAPAFMFAFLPLSVIFCVLFGKSRKKLCIALVGIVYQILLNMHDPINMIWLPLLILYSYFASQIVFLKRNKVAAILVGAVPIAWLITMKAIEYNVTGFVYPVGITLPALCACAYIWDTTYGEQAEKNFLHLAMYFLFFPIMLIGPFVGYSKFSELTDDDNMNISLERCAYGIRLFALGFIKRIAVGAVLVDGYQKIFAYSWDSPNLAIIVLLVILIYYGAYFSIWGYYDMAIGLSKIYGIDIETINANPFKIATVNEYSNVLFGSVSEWSTKYIVSPISNVTGSKKSGLLGICVTCICVTFFVRSEITALLLSVPMIAFAAASSALGLENRRKRNIGVRIAFGILTVMLIGVFWVFITMSGDPQLFNLKDITFENAEYQTNMVLMSFSGLKYLFVVIVALVSLLPNSKFIGNVNSKWNKKLGTAFDYGAVFALFAMFVFTVIFFLPQFEAYNDNPFMYVVI